MAANMALTAISRLFLSAAVTLTVACRPSAAVLRPDVAAVDSAAVPPLEYQVQYNAGDTGTLTVSLRARALGRAPGQIVLALSDWGEWTKAREHDQQPGDEEEPRRQPQRERAGQRGPLADEAAAHQVRQQDGGVDGECRHEAGGPVVDAEQPVGENHQPVEQRRLVEV